MNGRRWTIQNKLGAGVGTRQAFMALEGGNI